MEDDFEGILEFDWTDKQRQEGGYRRWLTEYVKFDEPIDIYDDILENDVYEDALQQIRSEYTGIIYDRNLSLVQGHYFTRCPDELVTQVAKILGFSRTGPRISNRVCSVIERMVQEGLLENNAGRLSTSDAA